MLLHTSTWTDTKHITHGCCKYFYPPIHWAFTAFGPLLMESGGNYLVLVMFIMCEQNKNVWKGGFFIFWGIMSTTCSGVTWPQFFNNWVNDSSLRRVIELKICVWHFLYIKHLMSGTPNLGTQQFTSGAWQYKGIGSVHTLLGISMKCAPKWKMRANTTMFGLVMLEITWCLAGQLSVQICMLSPNRPVYFITSCYSTTKWTVTKSPGSHVL